MGRVETDGAGTDGRLRIALTILVGALFFIWPLPHTISVRFGLLAITLVLSAYLSHRAGPRLGDISRLAAPLAIFVALIIWMYAVAIFISSDTGTVLHDIRGQWLTGALIMCAGALTALAMGNGWERGARGLLLAVFVALMLHVVYQDVEAVARLIFEGALPRNEGALAGGRDKMSYVAIFAVTFSMADGYMRASGREKFLPVSAPLAVAILLAILFSLYLCGARNAIALTLVLFVATAAFFILENGMDRRRVPLLAMAGVAIVAFGYASVVNTPQWRTLSQSLPLALDVENNRCWLDCEKYPIALDMTYSHSNYNRIAWFKVGAIIIGENPLGRGYEKSSFGSAVYAKYGEGRVTAHSHSDLIDFGIGNGIPGLVLLYAFFTALVVAMLRAFKANASFPALLLALLTFGVAVRSLADSMLRDHMLQQYMFLIGLLAVSAVRHGLPIRRSADAREASADD